MEKAPGFPPEPSALFVSIRCSVRTGYSEMRSVASEIQVAAVGADTKQ